MYKHDNMEGLAVIVLCGVLPPFPFNGTRLFTIDMDFDFVAKAWDVVKVEATNITSI